VTFTFLVIGFIGLGVLISLFIGPGRREEAQQ